MKVRRVLLTDYLSQKSIEEEVSYVFISVDLERDSINKVSEYVQHFSALIRGVTGRQDQLQQIADSLGISFEVSSDRDAYEVSHSITFSIIDPEAVFCGRFRPGLNVPHLAQEFEARLDSFAPTDSMLSGGL